MALTILLDREIDGRWICEVPQLPGVMAYGLTADEATEAARALAVDMVKNNLQWTAPVSKVIRTPDGKVVTRALAGTTKTPLMVLDDSTDDLVEHVCPTDGTAAFAAEWLERERLLGLITPEGAKAVEKLIEDLR